jgi:hypothetical protein
MTRVLAMQLLLAAIGGGILHACWLRFVLSTRQTPLAPDEPTPWA